MTTVISLKLLEMTPASGHSGDPLLPLRAVASAFSLLPHPPDCSLHLLSHFSKLTSFGCWFLDIPHYPAGCFSLASSVCFFSTVSPTSTFSAHCTLDHQAPLLSSSALLTNTQLLGVAGPLCALGVAGPLSALGMVGPLCVQTWLPILRPVQGSVPPRTQVRQQSCLPLGLENRADSKGLPFSEYFVFF